MFIMSEKTVDDLHEGRISGFRALITGRMKLKGSLRQALKFDKNVIRRYNPDEAYSKKTKHKD